ncbi:MAG: CRISPR-associated helicase Cas3' [Parabacteroides sp.]|nr:CRISPR-associated helicase Cas3' [Parabacteroides sp.]
MIISHIKHIESDNNTWKIQSDDDHNRGVAELASNFASSFGFAGFGSVLGLLHDKGKEQVGFQKYIKGITGYCPELVSSPRTPHAFVGALLARRFYPQLYPLLSYCIIGHHAGLPDYGDFEETMKKAIPSEIKIEFPGVNPIIPANFKLGKEDFHHLIRLLYSCLVDADFLDTESFMDENNARLRLKKASLSDLNFKLESFLSNLKRNTQSSEVNNIRNEVKELCIKSAEDSPGFYSLTVPTGGGKTISSIVWAIKHAIKYSKKRIIIAIPYTSIITQTAHVLRSIFGEENVLEHHSNSDLHQIQNKQLALKMKLATENWDYPIVVTTNVQLFESMFSNKPSSCRKLHNICNSVLILDEVQTLPLQYIQPIIDSLKSYQRIFGTTVLFTTASLPALQGEIRYGKTPDALLKGIAEIKEIMPPSAKLHERLRRVNIHFDEFRSSYDEIVSRIHKHDRVLCIVNTRKDAQEIYTRLPKEGLTLHLSRMMCSAHILKTINKLKESLADDRNKIIRVISTQLIEAGVDIDFPIVFRQEAGLDSILQAAGRCNREGKLGISDSYVFRLEKPLPKGYISNAADAQKTLDKDSDWFDPKTMVNYFVQLYSRTLTFDKANIKDYLYKPLNFSFETAAKEFKLIEENSQSVIVNYGNSVDLISKLQKEGPNYNLMKELGQYSVNVRDADFMLLKKFGLVETVIEDVYFVSEREQYSDDIGLTIGSHWLEEILIK